MRDARARARAAAIAVAALLLGSCDAPPPPPSEDAESPVSGADSLREDRQDPDPVSGALRGALERLLDGPEVPDPSGASPSWFTPATAGALRSAVVDPAGRAVVDFGDLRPLIPNASSSAGSAALLDELNDVVFGFPEVRSVEYRMEGSCAVFWEWLQYECHIVERTP